MQLAIETPKQPDKQCELTPVAGLDSLTFDDRRRRRSAVRLIVRLRRVLALGWSQIYRTAGRQGGIGMASIELYDGSKDAISSLAAWHLGCCAGLEGGAERS